MRFTTSLTVFGALLSLASGSRLVLASTLAAAFLTALSALSQGRPAPRHVRVRSGS